MYIWEKFQIKPNLSDPFIILLFHSREYDNVYEFDANHKNQPNQYLHRLHFFVFFSIQIQDIFAIAVDFFILFGVIFFHPRFIQLKATYSYNTNVKETAQMQ